MEAEAIIYHCILIKTSSSCKIRSHESTSTGVLAEDFWAV